MQLGNFSEVVALLGRPRCERSQRSDPSCLRPRDCGAPYVAAAHCPCFRTANPFFADLPHGPDRLLDSASRMLEEAHCRLAGDALNWSPADVSGAFTHWARAVDLARQRGQDGALQEAIRGQALDQARRLGSGAGDQRLEGLNRAVDLLRRLRDAGWDSSLGEVRDALVETLLERSFCYTESQENDRAARLDAQDACTLAPWSLDALRMLFWSSLILGQKLVSSNRRAAQVLLEEIDDILVRVPALHLPAEELTEWQRNAQILRDSLGEPRPDGLAHVLNQLPEPDLDPQDRRCAELLTQARNQEAERDFPAAVDVYLELRELDPDSQEIVDQFQWCYHWWIKHELENGTPDSLHAAVREAHRRFPNSPILADFFRDFVFLLK